MAGLLGLGFHIHLPRFRDACSMRRSGTALSFLLSEVSGRRWLYTGRGGRCPSNPYSETPRAAWRPTSRGETKPQRGHSESETQSRSLVQGCSHYLWVQGTNGEREAETLGSGTKVFYCPRKGGHTFGAEPLVPFWETEAGLKVAVSRI